MMQLGSQIPNGVGWLEYHSESQVTKYKQQVFSWNLEAMCALIIYLIIHGL